MWSINNVVNDLRIALRNRYVGDNFKIDEELLLDDMKKLEIYNYNDYVNLISLLFPVFYIFNENGACEYEDSVLEEAMNEIENEDIDNYDECELDEGFEEDDITYDDNDLPLKNQFYEFDDIDNIYDFIDWIKVDKDIIIDLFRYNFDFLDENYFEARELLNEYKDCDPYLQDMSKLWFIDKFYYCHPITKEEINYKYFIAQKNKIDRVETIDCIVNYIDDLGYADPENYKELIVGIINYSYRYQKYLLMSKNYDSYKDIIEQSVSYIENNSVSDINICDVKGENLYTILDFYFDFIESYDNNEKIISDFCDKNKCKIKSIKLI